MNLAKEIQQVQVRDGELAICWLGQAGFLLKDNADTQLVIDPYLTNCGEKIRGFKRLQPMLLDPADLAAAYYITTHVHFDHFDYEAIPVVAEKSPKTRFFGPESCMSELANLGVAPERCVCMNADSEYHDDRVRIHSTWADHGTMAPDAIGALVWMGGHCLYFGGDTAFREALFLEVGSHHPRVAMLSVNGEFGNMTPEEGAAAAVLVGCDYAIPCHCWMFREHHGEPDSFCRDLAGKSCVPICFRQGEILILDQEGKLKEPEGSKL